MEVEYDPKDVLAIVAARGGSEGVKNKHLLKLDGLEVINHTMGYAEKSYQDQNFGKCILNITLDKPGEEILRAVGWPYDDNFKQSFRHESLAGPMVSIDRVLRDACRHMEHGYNYIPKIVVLLYGNVPVRTDGVVRRCINKLIETESDSVQTVCPVDKIHPYWMYRLDEEEGWVRFVKNKIYRRQDLPQLYRPDGACLAVKYDVLMESEAIGFDDPTAFLGVHREMVVQGVHETVEIDTQMDLIVAEAILAKKSI